MGRARPAPARGPGAARARRRRVDQALVETPIATPEQNRIVETRAFFLADPGKGRVVETTEVWGEWERIYRDDFDGVPDDKRRGHFADYARRTYEAEELGTLTITPTDDLSVPFKMELEALRSGKAVTTLVDAQIQINDWPVLSHLVEALEFDVDDTAAAPRKSDLVLPFPHQQSFRYLITPPAGFAPGAVPESSQKRIGPATLARKFETDLKGVVTATLSLDTGRRQWTPAEVAEGHAALRAVAGEPMFVVRFEQVGEAHLAAGRIKEALAEFRRLAAASPQSAGPLARESRALIEAGLGEAARAQAERAIALDPGSSRAHSALGWVLQHDAVGRQFGKGWDRAGAISAMRKATEIEPGNAHMRSNLAILLEFNANGERYTSGGQLDEAIREYRAIRDELDVSDYDANLLNALAHAGRYGELRALAAELTENADGRAWQVVAVAAEKGAAAGIALAGELTATPGDRDALLLAAGETLVTLRFYPHATALLSAGAKGADDPQQARARIELLSRIRRAEEAGVPTDDPRYPVVELFLAILAPAPRADQLSELFAEASLGSNEFSPGSEGLAGAPGYPAQPCGSRILAGVHPRHRDERVPVLGRRQRRAGVPRQDAGGRVGKAGDAFVPRRAAGNELQDRRVRQHSLHRGKRGARRAGRRAPRVCTELPGPRPRGDRAGGRRRSGRGPPLPEVLDQGAGGHRRADPRSRGEPPGREPVRTEHGFDPDGGPRAGNQPRAREVRPRAPARVLEPRATDRSWSGSRAACSRHIRGAPNRLSRRSSNPSACRRSGTSTRHSSRSAWSGSRGTPRSCG